MQTKENVSLKSYNTFGIEATAAQFIQIDSIKSLRELIASRPGDIEDALLLGGGSNVLFTGNLDRLVVRNEIRGIEVLSEDEQSGTIKCGAGEQWHDLVEWTLKKGFYGLENLSLIPGTVGAAPMQNIGAYGAEIRNVFLELEAVHLQTGEPRVFNKKDCQFGYRESIFKKELKGQYFITSVTLTLLKAGEVNTAYGAIRETLDSWGVTDPTPLDVSRAVISIRQSKLPDPVVIGNAGSFFKNPVISLEQYRALKEKWTGLPGYNEGDLIKVPAGWLIEQCGWKGSRRGDAGVHEKQALVLVNHGGASGKELLDLSREIQASVKQTFHIDLEPEVNII